MEYTKSEAKAYCLEHMKGVWAALTSPFLPDGELDEKGLRANVRRCIDELKIDEPSRVEQPPEVYLELQYSGYIPDFYMPEPMDKMEMYKRISSVAGTGIGVITSMRSVGVP